MVRRVGLVAVCLLWGCAYRVQVSASPAGTQLVIPKQVPQTLPAEVVIPWRPFRSQSWTLQAPDHRSLEISVRKQVIRQSHWWLDPVCRPGVAYGTAPRQSLHFHLVEDHGVAGTWDADAL